MKRKRWTSSMSTADPERFQTRNE